MSRIAPKQMKPSDSHSNASLYVIYLRETSRGSSSERVHRRGGLVCRRRLALSGGPVEHPVGAARSPPSVGVAAAPGAGSRGRPSSLLRLMGEPRSGGGWLGRRPLLPGSDARNAHAGNGHHRGRMEAGKHHVLRLKKRVDSAGGKCYKYGRGWGTSGRSKIKMHHPQRMLQSSA